jgi:hypothetical protein
LTFIEVFYSHLCCGFVLISVYHFWLIVFKIVVVAVVVACFSYLLCNSASNWLIVTIFFIFLFVFDICFSRCDVIFVVVEYAFVASFGC